MYTIGQVSEMFNLPVSTLRYYDKEGLFPFMQRASGIRQFSDTEIAALKLIECLKKSGLEIRDIKQFMEWCQEGSRTYELRKQLFERQKTAVEKEMEKMQDQGHARRLQACRRTRPTGRSRPQEWHFGRHHRRGERQECQKVRPQQRHHVPIRAS